MPPPQYSRSTLIELYDSPCLRDEKRWESAKENATSNTHNDSPCLRDEKRWESAKEPICLQTPQNTTCNTHNDSSTHSFVFKRYPGYSYSYCCCYRTIVT